MSGGSITSTHKGVGDRGGRLARVYTSKLMASGVQRQNYRAVLAPYISG